MNRGRLASTGTWALAAMLALGLGMPAEAARRDGELEAQLRRHIEVLASDEFEGRQPGTEGEAKTLRYLGKQWFDIGLASGTNDPANEWFAPVTLVAREPAASQAVFSRKGTAIGLPAGSVLMLTSGRRALIRRAPVLFVGKQDIESPARGELAGRVALLLDADRTDGERQNALLAAGAAAVLTVLDGDRTLEGIAARRQRSGYALADENLGGDLEGFVTREGMEALLKGSGATLSGLEARASEPGFVPEMLDFVASLEATTQETTIRTHNLIGKIEGRKPDAGAVLLVAHWDHFGVCAEEPAEDLVCNGAVDNASGVAALTEIARRLMRGPRPDRDIYFLATTAEELGLLGAHAFAENPPVPLDRIVAAINIDSIALAPRGTPLGIVGRGMTALDPEIEKAARSMRRKIVSGDEANEYVKRQDGWALLQHDIPAVMVTSAYGDIKRVERFFEGDYHRPSDDLSRRIELGGAAEDVQFLTGLARWFADADRVSLPPR